jgi:hypothetical protein
MLPICPALLIVRDISGTYPGHMRDICGTSYFLSQVSQIVDIGVLFDYRMEKQKCSGSDIKNTIFSWALRRK